MARTRPKPDVAGLIDEMLEDWRSQAADDTLALGDWRGRSQQQVVTIMALTAHVHAIVDYLRPRLPRDLTAIHVPLVRSILEATVTVAWCNEVADGANALLNETARQRRNFSAEMRSTRTFAEFADALVDAGWGSLPTQSEEQARSMQKRCDDIALDGLYATYRWLSSNSHAGMELVDAYIDGATFVEDQPLSVRSSPGEIIDSESLTYLVACCLVWSGMVVNYLDQARTRRTALRRTARELGCPAEIAVRSEAYLRGKRGGGKGD